MKNQVSAIGGVKQSAKYADKSIRYVWRANSLDGKCAFDSKTVRIASRSGTSSVCFETRALYSRPIRRVTDTTGRMDSHSRRRSVRKYSRNTLRNSVAHESSK